MQTQPQPGQHLYGRGWLGLIPLVGGFVGLGLIFLGVFKYKNSKLTLIGLGALLFTIAVYGAMFYNLNYGSASGRAFSKISQERLNGLPKQIELYKMQYGQYPDSIEQFSMSERSMMFTDPLAVRKTERNANASYMYKRIGDKYTIFSVGPDGVPNTPDDLYPVIAPNDKLNYGLLVRTHIP